MTLLPASRCRGGALVSHGSSYHPGQGRLSKISWHSRTATRTARTVLSTFRTIAQQQNLGQQRSHSIREYFCTLHLAASSNSHGSRRHSSGRPVQLQGQPVRSESYASSSLLTHPSSIARLSASCCRHLPPSTSAISAFTPQRPKCMSVSWWCTDMNVHL